MDSKKLPKNLHVIPYIPGIAEYAALVREELIKRRDSDFLIAVDLPHGLESQVITATKSLPRVSVIVDQLFRGIPIIPTSAPIEAVRSFGETGTDVRFIDTSLPVTGNLDDYRYFIDKCRQSGVGAVIKNAELYGISPKDILRSWVDSLQREKNMAGFCHIPQLASGQVKPWKSDDSISPYLETRLQYMAIKLQELLNTEIDVVMICSISHKNGILHFLQEPLEPIDDSFVVPSKICSASQDDIIHISPEVPYFMYLYELFRDIPIDRQKWINTAYCGTEREELPADTIMQALKYSYNLALTDEDLFPGIYNLVAAAKYCVDDDFAFRLFELLRSYPPSKKSVSEFNVAKLLDYNFRPLGNSRSLTLRVSLLNDSHGIKKIKQKIFPKKRFSGYSRFTRAPESLQAERDFMKYMIPRFTAFHNVEDEYCVHEFTSGFEEGIDIRETIRNSHFDKLYVRQLAVENQVCYVMDYRSADIHSPLTATTSAKKMNSSKEQLENPTRFYREKIFFDKNYPWVGLVSSQNFHYMNGVMVAFAGIKKDPIPMMDELSASRPLESAVLLGTKYARQVFVFTDYPEEISADNVDLKRVKILSCSAIPPVIYEKMRTFDILYWRRDDKKGD